MDKPKRPKNDRVAEDGFKEWQALLAMLAYDMAVLCLIVGAIVAVVVATR